MKLLNKLLNKYNQPHVETTIVSYASESSNDNCLVVFDKFPKFSINQRPLTQKQNNVKQWNIYLVRGISENSFPQTSLTRDRKSPIPDESVNHQKNYPRQDIIFRMKFFHLVWSISIKTHHQTSLATNRKSFFPDQSVNQGSYSTCKKAKKCNVAL